MKRRIVSWASLPLATLIFCAFAYTGCVASPTSGLPDGFTEFTGTQAEWDQKVAEGTLVLVNSAADASTAAAQDQGAQSKLANFKLEHPELAAKLDALVAPADLTDAFAKSVNLRSQGDLYLQDLQLKDGAVHTYGLLGDNFRRQILAGAVDAYSRKNAVASSVKVYTHLYNEMLKDNRFSTFKSQFPTPDQIAKKGDLVTVNAAIAQFDIVRQLNPIFLNIDPRPAPESEEGVGTGGDRRIHSCTTLSSKGVMGMDSYNFPLKYYTTSVKDQSARGSCVAFGVNAALESAWARDSGHYVNLSEQDLYYHMKGYWWPAGDAYGDGSDQHAIFDKMAALGSGYYVPFENQWDYNPSASRVEDPENCGKDGNPPCLRKYTHSCDGYSEFCSDTNHQGGAVCILFNGNYVCGYGSQVAATSQKVRAASDAEIWDHTDVDKSVSWTLLAMLFKSPVVAGIAVPPSFDHVSADGYVTYAGPNEKSRGGHAVEVIGFIDDAALPTGAPAAGAAGGGGYFIIKNSWGTCAGDTGFYYLPYQWMKDYAYSMVVLNGIAHR